MAAEVQDVSGEGPEQCVTALVDLCRTTDHSSECARFAAYAASADGSVQEINPGLFKSFGYIKRGIQRRIASGIIDR